MCIAHSYCLAMFYVSLSTPCCSANQVKTNLVYVYISKLQWSQKSVKMECLELLDDYHKGAADIKQDWCWYPL